MTICLGPLNVVAMSPSMIPAQYCDDTTKENSPTQFPKVRLGDRRSCRAMGDRRILKGGEGDDARVQETNRGHGRTAGDWLGGARARGLQDGPGGRAAAGSALVWDSRGRSNRRSGSQ